ncbi:MAG: CRTAC1 family protein, partial [Bryobacteraceae bacterium]
MKLTRRQLLWGGAAFGLASRPPLRAADEPAPLFEEIRSSASGIEWVHDNAMSDNRYLPETLGPGCAFLDFDNDGWMDVYL